MNKYDRFWQANDAAGNVVQAVADKYGRYGAFSIDNADVLLFACKQEGITPATAAVTWCDETTYRFYSESNPNTPSNPKDVFTFYDVGPLQVNVGLLKANIAVGFLKLLDLNLDLITGTQEPIFNGDPIQNIRAGCRTLRLIGRGGIGKKVDGVISPMYPKLTPEKWEALTPEARDERRVVAYTGPEARPARLEHWQKYGPMFTKFFDVYR